VLLRDDSLVTLQGDRKQRALSVRFGEFLIGLRRKLERNESFKVRTPAAVAAVRGTLFWGRSDAKDKSTTYAGFGRTVAVRAKGKTVLVTPGKTVVVPFGQPPGPPEPSLLGLDYAKHFEIDGQLRRLTELAESYEAAPEKPRVPAPEPAKPGPEAPSVAPEPPMPAPQTTPQTTPKVEPAPAAPKPAKRRGPTKPGDDQLEP
jgi:hypothetical protein